MATSPNFSWPEPDNTDLVKNGALAIRTAVNAIDSSMVDLKGGTTGQILAKATNTDMDFVWVANDVGDITAVTASSPLTGGGTSGAITVGIQDATTSVKGAVQLSDSTSTTSSTLAATSTAVKSAFDLANTASTNNNNITMVQQYTATESVLKNVPSRIPVAEQLLKQAVYWIDAAQADNSDQVLDNQGWGAPALTTQLGSSASADSNDPKFLDFTGINYVYLTGSGANYLSTPDATALDITGDIDLRVQVAMDDWTPAATTYLLSKYIGASMSYAFRLSTDGTLRIEWSADGTTILASSSTVATGITDGTSKWVRTTLDVDNGASGNDAKFFTSNDGITWTQLGTTVTTAGVTSIFNSTNEVQIGARNSGSGVVAGNLYRAQIFNGIAGTKVLDIDTSIIGSGSATSFSALTGQTVTINRSTSGKKTAVVTHPVWLFGTDDYMTVSDNALLDFDATESFTIIGIVREWATGGQFGQVVSKFDSQGSAGYGLGANGTNLFVRPFISDNTNTVSSTIATGLTAGAITTVTAQIDRTAQTMKLFYGATEQTSNSITAVGSLANSVALNIGNFGSGSPNYYSDMELFAAAIFRRALTAGEITTITNYYTARVGA